MTKEALQNHCMCLSMAGYTLINVVCEVDVFLSEVSQFMKNRPPPALLGPTKFIAHGCIFRTPLYLWFGTHVM